MVLLFYGIKTKSLGDLANLTREGWQRWGNECRLATGPGCWPGKERGVLLGLQVTVLEGKSEM